MNDFKEILLKHYQKYPLMQVEDIFKLAYQSTFGMEHLISDKEAFIKYLNEEISSLDDDYKDDDSVDIGNNYSRISLYKVREDEEKFLDAFFDDSSNKQRGYIYQYKSRLKTAKKLISEKLIRLNVDDFDAFYQECSQKHFPCVRHSDIYRKAYHPHYRLIRNKEQ